MKIILFANTDWYLYNYRLPLARALRERGDDVLLLSPAGRYSDLLQAQGFHWQPLRLSRRGINPLAELGAIVRLVQLYRQERPALVHHFTIKGVLYGSLAARLARVGVIVNSITGLGYVFNRRNAFTLIARPLTKWLYRYVLRGTRVIFQNQQDMGTFIQEKLLLPGLAVLIPGSGVDVKRFFPVEKPDGLPLVVLPARMLWDKGVGEFVDAARMLKNDGIDARFALVGETDPGNPTAIPLDQLQEWQAEQAVEWWGWQDDMAAVYQKAALVCLPSYHEGLAKSLIEGAACGCALVASDIPGCREVVREGVNGLLVPPKDSRALADALKKVLSDAQLRNKMGEESRKIAVDVYDVNLIVQATLKVYN